MGPRARPRRAGSYAVCLMKVTSKSVDPRGPDAALDRVEAGVRTISRSLTQVRAHEHILKLAGVRVDRAGAALLIKLDRYDGGSPRVTELAERIGVDTPSVTRKVQQLESDGLVRRDPDPDDRRASRISLTRRGRDVVARVRRAHREILTRVFDDWDRGELSAFSDMIGRFAEGLEREMEPHGD